MLLAHLLDYLKIDKTWLAGNSMGGEVSLDFAMQNPQRVAGLILIDSAGVGVPGSKPAVGGKAFVTMTGAVAAVQAAVDAGAQVLGSKGLLVNKIVIPAPRKELLTEIV